MKRAVRKGPRNLMRSTLLVVGEGADDRHVASGRLAFLEELLAQCRCSQAGLLRELAEGTGASADALATAELALILFSRARQQQIHSPLNLQQRLNQWKRRQRTPSF